ncbi:hypothetical protein DVV91_12350 [Clostridium botulinum]|uniref:hypothetical protein n=1 Tax=Clostridium botulinum TaxID=1491 RepID=UPI000174E6E1|nr:hypothetical protein [Clostridium botulinum]ACD52316.1 hypothetical protein CLH_2480 [Clostridium botulinum E3 str. Alaska E43]AJF30326.1 hypothetical protein ST13_11680 [Clostridium botulinum]AJF33389.1 hypothetical protein ST12_11680 [Clostridium botulinum]MBN1049409.1 hypothetical protein [Clostridium botulinum]MBN1075130.1 hypothetical protein [Clostridium botulinum]
MLKIRNDEKNLVFILKYFSLGTIDATEIRRYERSKKKKINVTLGMIIGGDNIHYNVLYTEEEIIKKNFSLTKTEYELNTKQDRKSTLVEKVKFINDIITEFNQYYDNDTEKIILTVHDSDIEYINKKIRDITFHNISEKELNSIIIGNRIQNDIFYYNSKHFKVREFKSLVEVKEKVKKLISK